MKFPVVDLSHNIVSEVETEFSSIKNADNLNHVLYLISKYQRASFRQGTSSSKTRAEVSGGGSKPYKQKGTGHARRGSNRTPLRRGGGRSFGPKPRDFSFKLNQSLVELGIGHLLSAKAQDVVVVSSEVESFKTSGMAAFIKKYSDQKTVAFVLEDTEYGFFKGLNNLPYVTLMTPRLLVVSNLTSAAKVYITSKALQALVKKD